MSPIKCTQAIASQDIADMDQSRVNSTSTRELNRLAKGFRDRGLLSLSDHELQVLGWVERALEYDDN